MGFDMAFRGASGDGLFLGTGGGGVSEMPLNDRRLFARRLLLNVDEGGGGVA